MRKKFFRKLMAAATAMLLTIGSALPAAAAATTKAVVPVITPTGFSDSTVTLHLYSSDKRSEGVAGVGTENPTLPGDAKPLEGATFQYGKVGELVQFTQNTQAELRYEIAIDGAFADKLHLDTIPAPDSVEYKGMYYVVPDKLHERLNYVLKNEEVSFVTDLDKLICTEKTNATNEDGIVSVTSMNGLYLFMQDTMPNTVNAHMLPFLVSAPMPNTTGNGWNTNIHVYPKVSKSNEMKIVKTAQVGEKDPAADMTVQTGEEITYTVTTTVYGWAGVENPAYYTEFVLKDTMSPALESIKEKSSLILTGANGVPVNFTGDDIHVAPSTNAETGVQAVTVTFTDTGLEKLNTLLGSGDATLKLSYKAKLKDTAKLGIEGNKNTAAVAFKRQNGTGSEVSVNANVYTYGVELTKKLSDNTTIDAGRISFALQVGDSTMAFTEKGDGEYWAAAEETADAKTELYVAAGGKLKICGLAPGTYQLVETKTIHGYSLLAKPVTIVIEDTLTPAEALPNATADGQNMQHSNQLYQLTVVNTKQTTGFTLPQTGGEGMLVALAVGFGFVGAAVLMLLAYRRRMVNTKENR